jgi:nucleoid-associated protein YgaU
MTDPTQALLQFVGVKPTLFAANSRYQATPTATYAAAGGQPIAYLTRRFAPQPAQLVQVGRYVVKTNDRLDIVAARYLGDPTLFWRICDANGVLRPDDATAPATVGATLRICLPQGAGGGPNAS